MGGLVEKHHDAYAISLDAPKVTRDQIQDLQAAMLPIRCDCPQPEHFFAHGQYCRRFSMPAGMLVVGKIHKHDHLMMLLKGSALVISEFGSDEIEAGYVAVSKAGVKRVVLAIEDCVFATVHNNPENSQDLVEIESAHIEDEQFIPDYHVGVGEDLVLEEDD
jgi:hypothetical protein